MFGINGACCGSQHAGDPERFNYTSAVACLIWIKSRQMAGLNDLYALSKISLDLSIIRGVYARLTVLTSNPDNNVGVKFKLRSS